MLTYGGTFYYKGTGITSRSQHVVVVVEVEVAWLGA